MCVFPTPCGENHHFHRNGHKATLPTQILLLSSFEPSKHKQRLAKTANIQNSSAFLETMENHVLDISKCSGRIPNFVVKIPKCGGLMSLYNRFNMFFSTGSQSHFKQCGWTPVGWWNHQLKLNPSWLRHLWMDWSSWSLQSRIAPGGLPSGCQQIQSGIVTNKFSGILGCHEQTKSRPVSYDSYDFTLWLFVT